MRRKYVEYNPKNGEIISTAVTDVNPNRNPLGFTNYIEINEKTSTDGMLVDIDTLKLIKSPIKKEKYKKKNIKFPSYQNIVFTIILLLNIAIVVRLWER